MGAIIYMIKVNCEPDMEYMVTLPDGTSKTYTSSPFTITGLTEKGTYSVVISHRFKGDAQWGTKTATLTIGAFEGEVKLDITHSEENGDITITQISEGFTRIELVKEDAERRLKDHKNEFTQKGTL